MAIEALLERNLPRLRLYVNVKAGDLIRHKESCSDLVQSVCREVLEDLPGFEYRGEAQFRHWLFKQALHKIVDRARYYRAEVRDAAVEEQVSSSESLSFVSHLTPSRDAIAKEKLALVDKAFERLPEDYREAIILRRLVGLSYEEIAGEMERSEGAVRNLVYRGLARIAVVLGDAEEVERQT